MTRPAALLAACALAISAAVGLPSQAGAVSLGPDLTLAEVVVKVDLDGGHSIDEVTAENRLVVTNAVLASRGIYLVRSTDPKYADPRRVGELAGRIEKSRTVVYAEPDLVTALVDNRFHAWPNGGAEDLGTDPAVWSGQAVAARLQLPQLHGRADGSGVTVAVLDTGADATHPALAGRLESGWDYVDDDTDPSEEKAGTPDPAGGTDSAYGHGTFVSGVIALVAPGARIMAGRVLDSNGRGNVFAVSQAVLDAADAGADVINLSLGTSSKLESHLLQDAIKEVRRRGVVVIAAAGNLGTNKQQYPAAQPEVVGVGALAADTLTLTGFSGRGDWVDVAAPGEKIVGPIPDARYARWDGTSVAAPFVAGQVALIKGKAPRLDAPKVVEVVNRTTDRMQKKLVRSGAIDLIASVDYAESHNR